MEAQEYQKHAIFSLKDHQKISEQEAELLDWCLGISGEGGEICEITKHMIFSHEALDIMKMAKEIGDVLWYITALCDFFGIELSDIMELNIAKLENRYAEGHYTHKASAERHQRENAFEDTLAYKAIKRRIIASFAKKYGDVHE